MSTTEKKEAAPSTAVAKKKSDITTSVLAKVEAFQAEGSIELPKNFSAPNALKAAYIVLSETKTKDGKPVLEACTDASIAQALLKSITWGLSVGRGQCYFVPFGDQLQCMVSYQGEIANAKRMGGVKEVNASCIMEGDEFEFKTDVATGRKQIVKHQQTLKSIGSGKILGAYAVVVMKDGTSQADVMDFESIKTSWAQGSNSPAKTKFPIAMAERTVIRRALKTIIRSSDDSYLDNDNDTDETKAYVNHKIDTEANGNLIDIEDASYEDVEHEEVLEKPKSKPDPEQKPEEEKPGAGTGQPKMNF